MAELNTDVRFVRGVGEARAKSLAKLGITDLKSLISYFPRAYEDRRESRRIAELQVGERACVTAMVASEPKLSRIRKGLELVKLRVVDESAALELTYFNQSYLKNTFHVGESYTFYGTVEGTLLRRTMTNPVFEREGLHAVTGCIVPVYPLTAGVGQSLLHRAIRQGLDEGADRLPDLLPAELRRQHGLCDVRYAYENNYTANDDFKRKEFKVYKENVETVYLTEKELDNLYNLELNEGESCVRDSFIVSSYTGLRYSDIARLQQKHLDFDNKLLTIVTQKTNTLVVIPMHPKVEAIFRKYGNQPPAVQSNQSTNRILKKLCRKAGITNFVSVVETSGGIKHEITHEKCDMVTSHTARRSFATNAYRAGIPSLSIMQITGHSTETSFMKYIRISKEENAIALSRHTFFNHL